MKYTVNTSPQKANKTIHEPRIETTGSGLNLFYKDKYLYSKFKPQDAQRKIFQTAFQDAETLYLAFCPLFFYGIESLNLGLNSTILFIEPNPDLISITQQAYKVLSPSTPFELWTSDATPSLSELLKMKIGRTTRKTVTVKLSSAADFSKEAIEAIEKESATLLDRYWKNRSTLIFLSPIWYRNLFKNLTRINRSIPFDSIKIDKPILVLGAGISFEKVVPHLKTIQKSMALCAADTILPALFDNGIIPDFAVALESQYYNLPDFIGVPKECPTLLLADLSAHPSSVRKFKYRSFFMSRFSDVSLLSRIETEFKTIPVFPPLGSVGIAAVYAMLQLTTKEVYTCGLDFAYVRGKTHSRGSSALKSNGYRRTRVTSEPMGDGETISSNQITNGPLNHYYQIFLSVLKKYDRVYVVKNETGQTEGIAPKQIIDLKALLKKVDQQNDGGHTKPTEILKKGIEDNQSNTLIESEKELLLQYQQKLAYQIGQKNKKEDETITLSPKLDYLTDPFPDRNLDLNRLTESQAARVLIAINRLLRVIG